MKLKMAPSEEMAGLRSPTKTPDSPPGGAGASSVAGGDAGDACDDCDDCDDCDACDVCDELDGRLELPELLSDGDDLTRLHAAESTSRISAVST